MTDAPDPYKVLQVDPEAEDEVIQAAYRRLAQKYHPDVAAGPEAAARMASINAAWEVLRDPARKASFDLARRLERRAAERAADATAGAGTAGPADAAGRSGPAPARPGSSSPFRDRAAQSPRPPDPSASDWSAGRSSQGSGYDPSRMRAPDGFAAAGPPPGDPSGSVLNFGRYAGWSLGEIARRDLEYVEWLDRMPIGRPYRDEIDAILRRTGRRRSAAAEEGERRGLFRRR
jgi:curved DNA-binding protein CbpA